MQLHGKASRVTIYIGEDNRHQGKPLYTALLELLRKEGAAGATVTRGLAGFGAHSRIRTANLVTLSADLPLRVEWVDQPEVVERLLPAVRALVEDGLITVETVDVVQYAAGRSANLLDLPVQAVMRSAVTSVATTAPVAEIVTLLLRRGYRSVPVVDDAGVLAGIISDGDLLRRAGLDARLGLQAGLTAEQVRRQFQKLQNQHQVAADIMTQPVVSIAADEPVRTAVNRMADRHLKRLPVVDAAGRLVGLVSRLDILRSAEYHHGGAEEAPALPRSGATLADLADPNAPAVGPLASAESVLAALEESRQLRVVVVDDERRPIGIISDGDLLRRSRAAEQPDFVARLRGIMTGQRAGARLRLDPTETAADLMTVPLITVRADAEPAAALRVMLQKQIKRLPVVDSDGRLVGLLGRASLLNWLLGSE